MELVDVGFRLSTGNINCCNENTCCVAQRTNRIEIQTPEGKILKLQGTTTLIFEKQRNGSDFLRQKKILEKFMDVDSLYQRTMSQFYAKLCKQFDPAIVQVSAVCRGVDFVEKYNKAHPLTLAEVCVVKKALEKLIPIGKTVLWMIDLIHYKASRIGNISTITNSNSPSQTEAELIKTPSIKTFEHNDTALVPEEKDVDKIVAMTEASQLHDKLCSIFQKRDLFDFAGVSLLSEKLHNLFCEDKKPKKLRQLAEHGISGYLRNYDAEKIIFASKKLHLLFQEHIPQFIKNSNYQLTTNDLNTIFRVLTTKTLPLDASVGSVEVLFKEFALEANNPLNSSSPPSQNLHVEKSMIQAKDPMTMQEVELDNDSE